MKDVCLIYSEIKRFAVHDGPGIRSTLFLKGCPLRCLWCHNPEGLSSAVQVAYYEKKCIHCGACVEACPDNVHLLMRDEHVFWRKQCIGCGKCEEVCLGDALKMYGRTISVREAYEKLMQDVSFYNGGGVTISGGEPLMQAEACASLLSMLKEAGIHTAIDTSGAVKWKAFEAVLPYTNLFLYDLKHVDPKQHSRLTGKSNELILANLKKLAETGASIEVRMPIIPGMNDSADEIESAGKLLSDIRPVKVVLLPYHSLAGSKYTALGMISGMPESTVSPSKEHMQEIYDTLYDFGLNVYCSVLE